MDFTYRSIIITYITGIGTENISNMLSNARRHWTRKRGDGSGTPSPAGGTSIFNMIAKCWTGCDKFANCEEDIIRPCSWGCHPNNSVHDGDEDDACKGEKAPHHCGIQCDQFLDGSETNKSVPLSPLDYVSAPAAEITFCMVFDKNCSLDTNRLKESLACTLGDYPLLAGHIELDGGGDVPGSSKKGEQLMIINSNRGVKWTSREARSSKHTAQRLLPFMHQIDGSKEFGIDSTFRSPVMHPCYYKRVKDATTLWTKQEYLMRVFLTRLKDGCFVLVVTAAHLVTDLQPLKYFMKSWSNYYTYQDMRSKAENHKRVMPTAQEYLFKIGHKILADVPPQKDVYDHYNVQRKNEFVWLVPSSRIFRYPILANILHRPRVKGVHVSAAAIAEARTQIRHVVNNIRPDAFVAGVAKATQILNEQSHLVPYPSLNPDFLSVKPFRVKIPLMVTNWNFSKGFENEVNFGGIKPIWMEPGTLLTKVAVIMPSPSHIRGGGYIITLQLDDRDIYLERDYGLM
eukprot:jgi/Picsp_1/4016/NSC_01528-R1_---NA---